VGSGDQLLVQLSTAYLNDYGDIPTDRINTRRTLLTGGSGVLAAGVIPPRAALIAAFACQGAAVILAALVGIPAVSWPLLVVAIGTAIFYTSPPLRLAWRGLGEVTTGLTAALLVPLWAYSLQTGSLGSPDLLRVSLPLLLFITAMMLGIAAPDVAADRQVGKRTLAVRIGESRIAPVYAVLVGAAADGLLLFPAALIGVLAAAAALWAWSAADDPGGGWRLLLMVFGRCSYRR
jgi:1,4-dihydroxy-2-naphthoate octaprenyltransferase